MFSQEKSLENIFNTPEKRVEFFSKFLKCIDVSLYVCSECGKFYCIENWSKKGGIASLAYSESLGTKFEVDHCQNKWGECKKHGSMLKVEQVCCELISKREINLDRMISSITNLFDYTKVHICSALECKTVMLTTIDDGHVMHNGIGEFEENCQEMCESCDRYFCLKHSIETYKGDSFCRGCISNKFGWNLEDEPLTNQKKRGKKFDGVCDSDDIFEKSYGKIKRKKINKK